MLFKKNVPIIIVIIGVGMSEGRSFLKGFSKNLNNLLDVLSFLIKVMS